MNVKILLLKVMIPACFFLYPGFGHAQDLRPLRALYLQAAGSESACRELFARAMVKDKGSEAVLIGYSGAAAMLMARFALNPLSKLNWFRRGRDMLDRAIRMDTGAAELRYLRYCVQLGCPGFLRYNGEVGKDREFLRHFLDVDGDMQLKEMIRDVLKREV